MTQEALMLNAETPMLDADTLGLGAIKRLLDPIR